MRSLLRSVHCYFTCAVILIVSCKPTIPNQSIDSVEQLITQKIGHYQLYASSSGTYTLFVQQIEEATANPVIKFLVIESKSKKIILEKSFRPGYVKWIDDSIIEYLDAPGILKQNETLSDYIKNIDLATPKQ